VKPKEKPKPPKTLIPSGIDAVVWFDCSRTECLRRALGRRIYIERDESAKKGGKEQTNIIYHI